MFLVKYRIENSQQGLITRIDQTCKFNLVIKCFWIRADVLAFSSNFKKLTTKPRVKGDLRLSEEEEVSELETKRPQRQQ